MQRKSVLLPDPEGPMMQTTSEARTSRSMPRSTSAFPKRLTRRRTSITRAGATSRSAGPGARASSGMAHPALDPAPRARDRLDEHPVEHGDGEERLDHGEGL